MMSGMHAYKVSMIPGKCASRPHMSSRDCVAGGDYFSFSEIFND